MSNESVTPRDVLGAVTELNTWRDYPEARADFITYAVGLQVEKPGVISLLWNAYIFGWVSRKAHERERQILGTDEANRAEVDKLARRS